MAYGYTAQAPNVAHRYDGLGQAFQGVSKAVGGIETMVKDSQAKKQEEMDNVQAQGKYDATLTELSEFEEALKSVASPETSDTLSKQFTAMKAAVPIKEPGESTASYLNKLNQYKATVISTTAGVAGKDAMTRAAGKLLSNGAMTADQLEAESAKYVGSPVESVIRDAITKKRSQESAGTTNSLITGTMNTSTDPSFVGPIQPRPMQSTELQSSYLDKRATGTQIAPTDQELINKEIATRRGNETTMSQLATIQGTPGSAGVAKGITDAGGESLTTGTTQFLNARSAEEKAAADKKSAEDKALEDEREKHTKAVRATMTGQDAAIKTSESAQAAAEKELADAKAAKAKMTTASPEELKAADAAITAAQNKVSAMAGRTVDIVDKTEFPTEYSEATKQMMMERYVKPIVQAITTDNVISEMPKNDQNLGYLDNQIDTMAAGQRVPDSILQAIAKDKKGKKVSGDIRTFADPRPSDQPIPDNLKAWAKAEVRRQLGVGGAGSPTNPTNGTNQASPPTSDEEKYRVSAQYYLKRKGVENPSEEEITAAIAELRARRASLPAQRAALSVASK
jgi:hypothetical protein